jgi:hypothetical protein
MTKQVVFKTHGSNVDGALILNGSFEKAIIGRTEIQIAIEALAKEAGDAANGSVIVDIPDSK